ncbi:two-component system response regulator [Thermosulfurimonas marina]|uniref:Two-component system response regulator n=1 Tax=Thermosulfurimonas marina TaxID=2047767 RepID=A0A6H1WRM8_9BACT|nr:two-component system response regulator [Thermosulfurimonas marina]QJA05843.1 two-component system response regulator [Thermosulfurimonas marina]
MEFLKHKLPGGSETDRSTASGKKAPLILCVDDDITILELLGDYLEALGYRVLRAGNGREGLELARKHLPDLILLDVMMPEMSGFEVCRELKRDPETTDIPVVMVTALGEVEDRVRALEAGADDFLTKPVALPELKARVKSLLEVKAYRDHLKQHKAALEREVDRKTRELQRAFEALREAHRRIKELSLEVIVRLSRAAEYRDEHTGEHILRIAHYSAMIARKLGLNEEAVESILYAAPLHDIGKIGIPDQILLKPGPLTPEEWEIMKKHTKIGAEILKGTRSGFVRVGEVVALYHHERWDGTGYPQGLKGPEIPLAARIVAVADVFDAVTSDRPYRKAMSNEEAFRIIEEGAGSHFDPRVARVFLKSREEILLIQERFQDREPPKLYQLVKSLRDQR